MSIANYSELVSAIGDWLDRDDLAVRAPDFIRLTEVRLNRVLEDPDMEVAIDAIAVGTYTALPTDFGAMVSVTTGEGPLAAMGAADFAGINSAVSGIPRYYTIVDGSITFAPANNTAAIHMVYRRNIPPLTAIDDTNWLLERAPDLYLYGSLVQASAFIAEDDRLELWKSSFDEAIGELRQEGARRKWGAGPIAPRIGRP